MTMEKVPSGQHIHLETPKTWVEWGTICSDVCLRAHDAAQLRAQANCVELGEKRDESILGMYASFDVEFEKIKALRRTDGVLRDKERVERSG